MDQRLSQLALAARERVMHSNEILALATRQYHRAINSLHESGASTRDIADLLDMSHQRVHQIVGKDEEALVEARERAARMPNLGCTFCGKSKDHVQKLIAGPGVYICNECIELCNDIISDDLGKHL